MQPKPWITKAILNLIKIKQKLYYSHFLKGNAETQQFYKKYANLLTRVKSRSKSMYHHNSFYNCRYNSNSTWKLINELITSSSKRFSKDFPSNLQAGSIEVNSTDDIAKSFNDYFSSIGSSLSDNIKSNSTYCFSQFLGNKSMSSIFLHSCTLPEVFNILNSLKSNSASGPDGIPPYFVRTAAPVLTPYLTFFINLSFKLGIFPNSLKVAKVIPIHKHGSKSKVENYRPISLLSVISKVFEKALSNRILNFFDRNSVLHASQFGFRKNHNTTHATLDLLTEVYDNIENDKVSCLIALDLKKAFDTVNHQILLNKLDHYGIRGLCYNIIHSYLENRTQFVNIQSINSPSQFIRCGVPQGSILGPLLFLVYINDLPNALSCNSRFYADDTCLVLSDSSLDNLQKK